MLDQPAKLQHIREVGHELRNALTSVLSASEVLRQRCGDAVAIEYELITRQVQRMVKLVDEMLEFTDEHTSRTGGAVDR